MKSYGEGQVSPYFTTPTIPLAGSPSNDKSWLQARRSLAEVF